MCFSNADVSRLWKVGCGVATDAKAPIFYHRMIDLASGKDHSKKRVIAGNKVTNI
jgi:hypothetical protein